MLTKLQKALSDRKLPYLWNNGYNLLEKMSQIEMANYAQRLSQILNKIDKSISENKYIIAEYMCK